MPTKNKEKQRAYIRAHYQKNKAYYLAKSAEAKRTRRAYIQSLKNRPCDDCDVLYPYYVTDFDHRPGTVKVRKVSQLARFSKKKIDEEVAKCDLVCANCHRVRTFTRMERHQRDMVA